MNITKIVLMLTRTLSMSTEVSDCGSKHLIGYDVLDKNVLKKLSGKYYKLDKDDDKEDLKIINFKRDKHLIGKKVYVRSAATCALKNHVCAKCIGETAVTNQDIANGLSAFELTSSSNKTPLIAGNSCYATNTIM